MSHLDEGTLHALLDGELDLHEVKEIQAHIGSCAACGTRLREVKEFHGESDRLVGLLEMPNAPSRRTAVADDDPVPLNQPVAMEPTRPPRPPRHPPRVSGPAAEPPPLLLPENPDYGRARFMRRMRWAALILVTVGAGYLGNQMRQSGSYDADGLALPTGTNAPTAVVSQEEAAPAGRSASDGRDSGSAPEAAAESKTRSDKPSIATGPVARAPQAKALRKTNGERRDQGQPALAQSQSGDEGSEAVADSESTPADAGANVLGQTQFVETDEAEKDATPPPPSPGRPSDVRREANEALQELDRENRLERARVATAALDSARQREALAARQAAATPPAPRTPEQRAQIYLRIGLDEAAKQLGRPVHVIEGRSPLFMGLALGRFSPGADATRPVVRVVYQDPQGRLILLDQQRIRPGQATTAPGADPHWTAGEVALHLSGEVGPEVLRSLRSRVR